MSDERPPLLADALATRTVYPGANRSPPEFAEYEIVRKRLRKPDTEAMPVLVSRLPLELAPSAAWRSRAHSAPAHARYHFPVAAEPADWLTLWQSDNYPVAS